MMLREFRAVENTRDIASALLVALRSRTGHLGLTGGGTGIAVLRDLAGFAADIPWSNWNLWWGDERYERLGSLERNDAQADLALLDLVPNLNPAQIHRWPSPEDSFHDPDVAARAYAASLNRVAPHGMDLLLLGVGPDGHVASLFPPVTSTMLDQHTRTCAVRNSPKPPPTRTSFTMSEICQAREVWLFTLGKPKIADALRTQTRGDLPVSHVRGTHATVVWTDAMESTDAQLSEGSGSA